MADDSNNNSPPRTRRSSFAGQTFADIFGTGRSSVPRPSGSDNSPPNSYPGPITNAAAQAQRRRLSLTTLGLGSGPGNTSAFGTYRSRNDSLGSADNSIDECAVEDGGTIKDGPVPSTPFARRVSFGARAMMDIKTGTSPNTSNGRSSPANASSGSRTASIGTISSREVKGRGLSMSRLHDISIKLSPPQLALLQTRSQRNSLTRFTGSGEGFNWSDNLRTRAERSSNAGLPAVGGAIPVAHQRAKSVAVMEPPIREAPRESKRPDHFQERILKGDFYMD